MDIRSSLLNRRILPLSLVVANQIAAGEVIERPASVVKELLENALDAGASNIYVDIGFGGLNQIKISDNGCGIVADDLPLAILAHATSKITELNDLYAIESMGFRGEALASIASVSRLSITSKPLDQEHARLLYVEGASHSQLLPAARAEGTTVEVLDLFFNAPVRKKFLKSPRYEYLAIEHVVKRFALSAMDVAITLKHNGQLMLTLPPAHNDDLRGQRIRKILGKSFFDQSIFLEAEQAEVRLLGWISEPSYQRSQNDKQWVYINQRMVKDKLVQHAIKQAYDNILHPGRHPACLLYLTLPSEAVDVNVHPTKHEVRFQDAKWIHDFIRSHIANVLLASTVTQPLLTVSAITSVAEPISSLKTSLSSLRSQPLTNDEGWTVLNSQFILLFIEGIPYCVDVEQVEHDRLLSILKEASYPLESRALFVPVRYQFDAWDSSFGDVVTERLLELGIQLDWISKSEVRILSIPLLGPRLNLQKFLCGLHPNMVEVSDLWSLFVASQSLQLMQWSLEERSLLISYLHACGLSAGTKVSGCIALDEQVCRTLLGGGSRDNR